MQSSHLMECWVTSGVFSWGRLQQQPLTFQWARNHPVESSRRPPAVSSWGSWAIWCGTASLTVSPPALPLLPMTTPGWCSHLVTEKLKRKLFLFLSPVNHDSYTSHQGKRGHGQIEKHFFESPVNQGKPGHGEIEKDLFQNPVNHDSYIRADLVTDR